MNILKNARDVIETEIQALQHMIHNLDESFSDVVSSILQSQGRIIICGMGKSGIIGKKIAASLASTGTPSFFMHPGEAFHGDLGMVKNEDVFIAISNSGETEEVVKLLPFLADNNNTVIAITGNKKSTLAINAHFHLDISVPSEACPFQLAPTSSTTATLVMGDALTVTLMMERNFQPENFARFHPGGSLGRRLLGKVRDDMVTTNLPIIKPDDNMESVINTISSGKMGFAIIEQQPDHAIVTDGDVRRAMLKHGKDVFDLSASDIAVYSPLTIGPDVSIQNAYEKMENSSVSVLFVRENEKFLGILRK